MTRCMAMVLVCTACTAIADFPADRLDETTDALCGNEIDDDRDGLTDCQDWTCLGRVTCCNTPSVVIEDAFEGEDCAADACSANEVTRDCAPDPDRWTSWGVPDPFLCQDALAIHKDFATCYPVGVLSQATVKLEPGLRIEAEVSGTPEAVGRIDVGLTRQATVVGGTETCAPVAPVATMVGIVYAAADGGGVRFIATIADTPIGEVVFDEARERELSVWLDDELTLHFAVDAVELAAARDVVPPDATVEAHLVISGRGTAARVEHVRVLAGDRCDAPAGWSTSPSTPLDPAPPDAWDGFERRTPSASLDEDDHVHLRYVGCAASGNPTCSAITLSVGDADAAPQAPFTRPAAPFISTDRIVAEGFVYLDVAVIEDENVMYYGLDDYDTGVGADRLQRCEIILDADGTGDETAMRDSVEVVLPGAEEDDAWDGKHVCCPSVVKRDREHLLFYAGRADGETTWRIGLAISTDGGEFVRLGAVLEPDSFFDMHGVTQPWVIFDEERQLYRMWYTGRSSLSETSIGYAISTDGIVWHKFETPVVTPTPLGLSSIGSPTVVDDGGRLRMWIHGFAPGAVARTIYELENLGGDPPEP